MTNVKILVSSTFLEPVKVPLLLLAAACALMMVIAGVFVARSLGGGRK